MRDCELSPNREKERTPVLENIWRNILQKFSFDYSIHKDLGKFLRRELDFYIKEMKSSHLDDIEMRAAPKVWSSLGKVKANAPVAGKSFVPCPI